ncbi:hypothetical protein [Rhodanobacter sp. MP7CTX1]|uniref:hypothetical protein n=1 Tax=Rhodanobacter sp. MP7CTX1 TaxID=2723084 RepID=UPI001607159D|nr:hypothetical protein [Rhodanobacter sp. MP7CTX1]MBB6187542.1 hypothetical protein [Rhodanobacter sp. MP7CTX1]
MALAIVLALKLLSAPALAAPLPVPANIIITKTSGTPTAGVPISISWKLVNNAKVQLSGAIVYYLNGYPLTPLNSSNGAQAQPPPPESGTFTFDPVPGINQFSVVLLDTHGAAFPTSTAPKLKPTEFGQQPTETVPSTGHGESSPVSIAASGNVSWTVMAHTSRLDNGLTAAVRRQLMTDYAPLLLFSYDHSSDELYRPSDVLPYVKGSSLTGNFRQPNSALASNPQVILDPSPASNPLAGTITAAQPMMPVALYVSPSSAAESGADWGTVMKQSPNVGLYGHVTLIDPISFATTIADDKRPPDTDNLPQRLASRYGCTVSKACAAQIVKIEYWQFFGYSHDYEGPAQAGVDSETDHSGDWCSVQLYVDAGWWASPRPDKAILAVYHYLHGIQVGFDMGTVVAPATKITVPTRLPNVKGDVYFAEEFLGPGSGVKIEFPVTVAGVLYPSNGLGMAIEVGAAQNSVVQLAAQGIPKLGRAGAIPQGTGTVSYQHPVVYVEWGGHEFWPTADWAYYGANKHNGSGQYSYFGSAPTDLVIDHQVSIRGVTNLITPPDVALVTTFAGYWGASGGGGPPQGPPLHTHWYWDYGSTPQPLWDKIETIENSKGELVTHRTD